jgi:hypothetical protein
LHFVPPRPDATSCGYLFGSNLKASSSWISVSRGVTAQDCDPNVDAGLPVSGEVLAARWHGPAQTLEACRGAEPDAAAIDGDMAAFLSCDQSTAIVRRLGSPGASEVQIPLALALGAAAGTTREVGLAGDYLLVQQFTGQPRSPVASLSAVYRWPAATELYGFPGGETSTLEPDGTAVVAADSTNPLDNLSCPGSEIEWFSPSAPVAHIIPVEPCDSISALGDLVSYTRLLPGGVRAPALTTLEGAAARSLGSEADSFASLSPGPLVEFERDGCGNTEQFDVYPLSALLARGPGPAASCELRLARAHPLTVTGNGEVTVRAYCRRGCFAMVTIGRGGHSLPLAAPAQFDAGVGPARAQGRLRTPLRPGPATLELRISVFGPSGPHRVSVLRRRITVNVP